MIACASKNSKSWAHQVSISMVIVNRKHMFVVCSFLIHENKAKKIFHKETVKKNHRCPKTANTLNTSFYSFLRLSIPVRLSPLAFSIRKIYQGAPWPKKYRWFVSITRIFSTSSLLPQHAPMLRMEQQCIHWCILFSSFSFTGHSVGPRLTLVFVFAERLQGNNDPF